MKQFVVGLLAALVLGIIGCCATYLFPNREKAESIALEPAREIMSRLKLREAEFEIARPPDQSRNGDWIFSWQLRSDPKKVVYVSVSRWGTTDWQISEALIPLLDK